MAVLNHSRTSAAQWVWSTTSKKKKNNPKSQTNCLHLQRRRPACLHPTGSRQGQASFSPEWQVKVFFKKIICIFYEKLKNPEVQFHSSSSVVTWPTQAACSCSKRSAVSCSWRLKQALERESERGEEKEAKMSAASSLRRGREHNEDSGIALIMQIPLPCCCWPATFGGARRPTQVRPSAVYMRAC